MKDSEEVFRPRGGMVDTGDLKSTVNAQISRQNGQLPTSLPESFPFEQSGDAVRPLDCPALLRPHVEAIEQGDID